MITKITLVWMAAAALALGRPGDLVRDFQPDLRAWVAPERVEIGPDGRAWAGGGFDRADGASVGDLVRLGENGGVAGEPAPGYLAKPAGLNFGLALPEGAGPFLLDNGDFLLPGEAGGWLRMSAAGRVLGKAFPDRQTGETIAPQFERDGKLWVVRQFADGRRALERRAADGTLDGGFSLSATDAMQAVAGPDGGAWVLAGEPFLFPVYGQPLPARRIFQVDAAGNPVGAAREFAVPRTVDLAAGPAGAFRVVLGADQSGWMYWPSPTTQTRRIEWYSADGELVRGQDFRLKIYTPFAWAEGADGTFVATDASRRTDGGNQLYVSNSADLRRFAADGTEDLDFHSPGPVRSVKALADGKWLVDGLRRLNADGSVDAGWKEPQFDRPAVVKRLQALPDGRVLAGGDFATADGLVRNRLVVFRSDGSVDPAFVADGRIEEWSSLAVAGNAIYVATPEPVAVTADFRSNLVKLQLDGSLDESFRPRIFGGFSSGTTISLGPLWPVDPLPVFPGSAAVLFYPATNVSKILPFADGDILVETFQGGEVSSSTIARLNPDGSPDVDFQVLHDRPRAFDLLTLRSGGYVRGATIYRRDGTVERDFTREDVWLRPLCEWLGGVVFLEFSNARGGRLRLWTCGRWASWFRPAAIADWRGGVLAEPGEAGRLYVAAAWRAGRPELRRLWITGRADADFRAPGFAKQERQAGGNWWKAEEFGRIRFRPAAHEIPAVPLAMLWQPASQSLWTAGDFNVAGGNPRDGLARIEGGFRRVFPSTKRRIHARK